MSAITVTIYKFVCNCAELIVLTGGKNILTPQSLDLMVGAGLFFLAGIALLADSVTWIFSRSRLEEVLKKRNLNRFTRAACKPFLEKSDSLSLCCSLISVGCLAIYFIYALHRWGGTLDTLHLAVYLVLPLQLMVVLINILARLRTEEVLLALVWPFWLLTLPLRPLGDLVVYLENKISAFFNSEEENDADEIENIIAAVTDGEHEGVVEEEEREMIVNIFDLKNFDLSDIMTPRTNICAINIEAPFAEAIKLAASKGYSRIPVFVETRDNIKGVFYCKDALDYWKASPQNPPKLAEIMHKPFFVPETKSVGDLLRELQQKKMHLAIVLDEYGGTAGLVTIEDVVEEIVGEIQDEYDSEEDILLRDLGDGSFDVDARTHVHDMNEVLPEKIIPETDDYETLGGFVLDQLGHVPSPQEDFIWEGFRFSIISADERKVKLIRVDQVIEENKKNGKAEAS